MAFQETARLAADAAETAPVPHDRPGWRDFPGNHPAATICGALLLLLTLAIALGDAIWWQSSTEVDVLARLQAPSAAHPMGTDELGRDVLARVLQGGRTSLIVSALAVGLASVVGWFLGVASGYIGGAIDWILQRSVDVLLGMPALLMALAVVTAIGRSTLNVSIALAVAFVPRVVRVVRSQALVTRHSDFVAASVVLGTSHTRIMWRHIFPQTLPPYLVLATSLIGNAVVLEASISFIGLGVPPPAPTWGQSLAEAVTYFRSAPWVAIGPGAVLSLYVLLITICGDGLRDHMDPRSKQ